MRLSLFSLLPGRRAEPEEDLYEVTLRRAALADELGFAGFWVAEHHVREVSCLPSPAVFLAAAAQRTERIRLGTAVAVLTVRHPLLAAEEYALVDRLSGGRLDLGVGSGVPLELSAVGVAADSKRARFEETLEVLRRTWRGEGGPFTGRFYDIGELHSNVRPLQRPMPPIWVATGEPTAAAAAAAAGDGVLSLVAPDVESFAEIGAIARAHAAACAAGGRRPDRVCAAAALFTAVAASDDEADERACRGLDRLAASRGVAADGAAVVAAARARGCGFFGSPATLRDRLRALAAAGVGEALLWLDFGGAGEAEIEDAMRLVTSDVAPHL